MSPVPIFNAIELTKHALVGFLPLFPNFVAVHLVYEWQDN